MVLNLRDHLDLMNLPKLEREDNSRMRDVATTASLKGDSQTVSGRPKGGSGRPGGSGGRPGGGGGRPGGGRPGASGWSGGGGAPSPDRVVSMTMSSNDKDGDGVLSPDEIAAINSQYRGMVTAADTDADGSVTKDELTKAISKRMSGGNGR